MDNLSYITESHTKAVNSEDYDYDYYDDEDYEFVTTVGHMDDYESGMESTVLIVGISVLAVSLIISLIIFFGVVIRRKDPESRFLRWCKEFWNFRKIWIAGILKFLYVFLSVLATLGGFVFMFLGIGHSEPWVNVLVGLGIMTIGNLMLRISFEMTMLMIGLWENTADIRTLIAGVRQRAEEKKVTQKVTPAEPKSDAPVQSERKDN